MRIDQFLPVLKGSEFNLRVLHRLRQLDITHGLDGARGVTRRASR
jgi:hypothetical protein